MSAEAQEVECCSQRDENPDERETYCVCVCVGGGGGGENNTYMVLHVDSKKCYVFILLGRFL